MDVDIFLMTFSEPISCVRQIKQISTHFKNMLFFFIVGRKTVLNFVPINNTDKAIMFVRSNFFHQHTQTNISNSFSNESSMRFISTRMHIFEFCRENNQKKQQFPPKITSCHLHLFIFLANQMKLSTFFYDSFKRLTHPSLCQLYCKLLKRKCVKMSSFDNIFTAIIHFQFIERTVFYTSYKKLK